jgi:hypothetical protein
MIGHSGEPPLLTSDRSHAMYTLAPNGAQCVKQIAFGMHELALESTIDDSRKGE